METETAPQHSAAKASQQDRVEAIHKSISEAERVLEFLSHPGYEKVDSYYQSIIADYEQLLHNVNVSDQVRTNASFALDVLKKVTGIKKFYELKRKRASDALQQIKASKPKSTEEELERILNFVR